MASHDRQRAPRMQHQRKADLPSATRRASGSSRRRRADKVRAISMIAADSIASLRERRPPGSAAAWVSSASTPVQAAVDHPAQRWRQSRTPEIVDRGSLGRQPVARKIDAVEIAVVFGAVLQVIDHLQGVAKGIRRRVTAAMSAVQVEQEAADRRRRPVAVVNKLRPVRISALHRILVKGGDQVEAMA